MLQGIIADGVKLQVENALAAILELIEEAAEHIFRAASFSARGGVRTVVCDDVQHLTLTQIRMEVLGETIEKQVESYFESGKVREELGKRFTSDDEFLSSIASFVQTKTTDEISDQR